MPTSRRRITTRDLGWAAVFLAALALLSTAYLLRAERWSAAWQRTPIELVRYVQRRLEGHGDLKRLAAPLLEGVRSQLQPEPPADLPSLGKGQQLQPLGTIDYDAAGRPRAVGHVSAPSRAESRVVSIASVERLDSSLAGAQPGQILLLEPGSYPVRRTLKTGHAGLVGQPIVLRAARPGTVELVVTAQQGLIVDQPYWVFENLDWRGACARHDDCEHAYHVVGPARGVAIVNNRISDFNAHVKINGENGQWPDDGLVQYTSFVNRQGRSTGRPVNAIDSVGANGWQIVDNLVENTVKLGGNLTAYGLCIKGAGRGVRLERNRVVCTTTGLAQPGVRAGISLGCGGSDKRFCRDGRCDAETIDGVVANNVVAHCNDFGIDLLQAKDAKVLHNTLVNTEGIDGRADTTRATVIGNLVEGRIRSRDGAAFVEQDNLTAGSLASLLAGPQALDLRWLEPSNRTRATPETSRDFCGQARPPLSPPGATLQPRCDGATGQRP